MVIITYNIGLHLLNFLSYSILHRFLSFYSTIYYTIIIIYYTYQFISLIISSLTHSPAETAQISFEMIFVALLKSILFWHIPTTFSLIPITLFSKSDFRQINIQFYLAITIHH